MLISKLTGKKDSGGRKMKAAAVQIAAAVLVVAGAVAVPYQAGSIAADGLAGLTTHTLTRTLTVDDSARDDVRLASLAGRQDEVPAEPEEQGSIKPALPRAAAIIAACETGGRLDDGTAVIGSHDWQAENGVSTASGAFQFVDGTWRWVWTEIIGTEPPAARAAEADPGEQLEAFLILWDGGRGRSHWEASGSCWRKMGL